MGKGQAEPATMLSGGVLSLFQPAPLPSDVIPLLEPGGFQAEGTGIWPLFCIVIMGEMHQRMALSHLQPSLSVALPIVVSQYQIDWNAGVQGRFHRGEKAAFQQRIIRAMDAVRVNHVAQVADLIAL